MLSYLRKLTLILMTLAIMPFLALLALSLFVRNLIRRVAGSLRKAAPSEESAPSGPASIIILNWNGKDLLARGLPSVLSAVHIDGGAHEVLVVDNGSTDGSVEFVRKWYPEVRIVPLPRNLGFARGNNAGVRAASHDIVILLNNDMVVDPGFLKPLMEAFGPRTFAVASQIFMQDRAARREETGKTAAVFRRGMVDYTHTEIDPSRDTRACYPAFWAGGGSAAFHRRRFLALGGFDHLYSPAYVEDTDLSYRAWKAGWDVVMAPASIVHHRHRATSSVRFSPTALEGLIRRNQFLFIWKNISSWHFLLIHCLFLPWNCYRLARDHGLVVWQSLLRAVLKTPAAMRSELRSPFRNIRHDREVFELFTLPGLYFARDRRQMVQRRPRRAHGDDVKPRVLWMTAYLPHLGRHAGAGRMFQLLKRLSRKYRITLLTFLENDDEREFLPEVQELCERVEAMRRAPPPRWQLFVYEPFDEFDTPRMREAMGQCLESHDFNLVQLEYTQMACYADRAYGIPFLLTKHEVDFAACLRRARLASNPWTRLHWTHNYFQVLDREIRLLRRVDAAICMTEPDAHELCKFNASIPVHVINTGVDLEYFRPPAQASDLSRLVFVGAFQHQPNEEAMTYFCRKILPLIRTQVPETELLIVGSSPTPPVIGLTDIPGVQATGFVPDIRPYMASSSVYIVPLRLGVGIRGKILEAWGMAMPVVATSVACAGLKYVDGKNLLVADSPELFASHVVSLLKDPARRKRLGAEGRRLVEMNYGWDASAERLDALYGKYIADYWEPTNMDSAHSLARRKDKGVA